MENEDFDYMTGALLVLAICLVAVAVATGVYVFGEIL
jgi:hypothetical protein